MLDTIAPFWEIWLDIVLNTSFFGVFRASFRITHLIIGQKNRNDVWYYRRILERKTTFVGRRAGSWKKNWGEGGVKITLDYRPKESKKFSKILNIIGAFWEKQKYTRKSDFAKSSHNSLNNGFWAVLIPFLEVRYFWCFWMENHIFD